MQPIPVSGPVKQPLVVAALSALARELGPGGKLPTCQELMTALGVTKATLSRSLAHLEDCGILRCRQGSGIYVAAGALQKRVALVFGENIFSPSGSQFGSLLLQHCSRRAQRGNERFSYYIDTPVPDGGNASVNQDLIDDLKSGKIDGIVLVARNSREQETWLRSHGIPVIGTAEECPNEPGGNTSVLFDSGKLHSVGVDRLLRSGCKSMGILSPVSRDRGRFLKAIEAGGGLCQPRWIGVPPEGEISPVERRELLGRDLARQWLNSCGRSKLPDGLLIADDIMARGVLSHFARQNILPGRDITVCSHANKGSFALAEWEDVLLRVEFDPEQMAAAIFAMLEDLMSGKPRTVRLIPPL